MILNITNNNLYSDKGEYIKNIHCPKKVAWNSLNETKDSIRVCDGCSNVIYDTEGLCDLDVLKLVRSKPSACVAVRPSQLNVSISLHPVQNKTQ